MARLPKFPLSPRELADLFRLLPTPALVLRAADDRLSVEMANDAAAALTAGRPERLLLDEHELLATLDAGRSLVRESVLRHPAGDRRLLRQWAVPLAGGLLLLQSEDLEERGRTDTLVRAVFRALREGLLVLGPDGRLLLANEAAASLIGVAVEELLTDPDWARRFDVRREDDRPLVEDDAKALEALAAHGPVRGIWLRVARPDGVSAWLIANFEPLQDDGVLRGLVVTFTDATVRRQAQERFERAFEDAPIGMALVDLEGRYVRVNSALCSLAGRPREQLEGSQASVGEPPRELRLTRPDGTVVEASVSCSLVRGPVHEPQYYVCQYLDVSERRRHERELEQRAMQDHLTGLANRALFDDRLDHALARLERTGGSLAVLFLDLDEFKRVNDSLGHAVGDEVLVETARRLAPVLRHGDTLARFGGDEFTVLCDALDDVSAREVACDVAERLRAAVDRRPYAAGGQELHLGASIGVAICRHGEASAERLLADADAAMYRAKRAGGGIALAQDEGSRASWRLELEAALRQALAGEPGLRLVYQPIVALPGGEIVGVEALVRWDWPDHGPVPPSELIPIAEASGLVVPLGEWVLGEAMREVAERWPGERGPYVSINLSPRQFAHRELAALVADCTARHRITPARVCLEITESTAMADAKGTLDTLRRLRGLGVRLAIDDFGTGFSSLGYLKRFPVDAVKIDRAFADDVDRPSSEDRAIVTAVVSMAGALDLGVTAEGVETEAQRSTLVELGCGFAQGFLFARPAPLQDLVL